MLEVISVDCGRSGVKAVGETERLYFKSALGTYRYLKNERQLSVQDFITTYKTETYYAGQIAADECEDGAQMMTDYKAHTDTKILTLTAVHRLVKPGSSLMLVTGLPIQFHTEHDKMQMRRLLLGDHEIAVNNQTKRFTIERVEVAAEGAAAAWQFGRTRKDRFHVIDIGSRTINYVTMQNGRWVDPASDSLDYGCETFRGTENQLARVIIADLSKRLRPFGPAVVIGGKETLVPYLRQYHENIEYHPDALFATAVAFREMGVIALANQTKAAAR